LNADRYAYWISNGAQPSDRVASLASANAKQLATATAA
jgi:ribosomal protein S16